MIDWIQYILCMGKLLKETKLPRYSNQKFIVPLLSPSYPALLASPVRGMSPHSLLYLNYPFSNIAIC
jgi:hypothetical protein